MFNSSYCYFFVINVIIIQICSTAAQAKPDFWAYSSCNVETAWKTGYGPPIRSWINSLVPTFDTNDTTIKRSLASHFVEVSNVLQVDLVMQSGQPGSLTWKAFGLRQVDGWLYGNVQGGLRMTGHNIAYIYSDFKTVIIGRFRSGMLLNGTEAQITAYR
jgi:hypothetical protein